jgi:uncharacterized protein
MTTDVLAALVAATLFGSAAQAATGFGFALLAAPIYLTAIGSGAAIQVLVVLHLAQSLMLVPRLWTIAPRHLLSPLMLGSLVGFPIGLGVFMVLDLTALKLTVGGAMIVFALMLAARELNWLRFGGSESAFPRAAVAAVGTVAGLLTAVLVTPGPPLILLNGWLTLPKSESRALALTFFAFCFAMATALHATWGGMALESWKLAALLVPIVIVGTVAGSTLASRISEVGFRLAILAIAACSGAYAIASSL